MLLERYLAEAITTHFGHLLEGGLDKEKIRLSAWKGELVLNDLVLKRTALQQMQDRSSNKGSSSPIPVEIAYGRIGRLHIRIPWQLVREALFRRSDRPNARQQGSFHASGSGIGEEDAATKTKDMAARASKKCTVVLSDVNILVTPIKRRGNGRRRNRRADEDDYNINDDDNGDEEHDVGSDGPAVEDTIASRNAEREDCGDVSPDALNQSQVDREAEIQTALDAELLRRVAKASTSVDSAAFSTTKSQWLKFFREHIGTALWSQLVVTVRNIHFRYEDPGTSMGFVWNTYQEKYGMSRAPEPAIAATRPTSTIRYRPSFAIGLTLKQFMVHSPSSSRATISKPSTSADGRSADGSGTIESTAKNERAVEGYGVSENGADSFSAASPSRKSYRTGDATPPPSKDGESDGGEQPSAVVVVDEGPGYRNHRKVAAALDLAAYWDSDCQLMAEEVESRVSFEEGSTSQQFYMSAFERLNRDYAASHCFVLDPFSPSLEVKNVEELTGTAHSSASRQDLNDPSPSSSHPVAQSAMPSPAASAQHVGILPPGSLQILLPPCRLSLSRSLLQDLGYLRQSFSMSQKRGLSESAIRRLANLRPQESPLHDPRGWWKYSMEAVLILHRTNQGQIGRSSETHLSRRPCSRIKGWLAVARGLRYRKQYIHLYDVFLNDPDKRSGAHDDLLALEQELTVEEVVAFRIAAYFSLREEGRIESDGVSPTNREGMKTSKHHRRSSSNSRWEWSSAGQSSVLSDNCDEPSLTSDHRASMFAEMSKTFVRERINAELHELEEKVEPSKRLPGSPNERTITWITSISCPELSLRVHDMPASDGHNRALLPGPAVAKLSCAFAAAQQLYRDGSWDLTNRIGSLHIKDCTKGAFLYENESPVSDKGYGAVVFPNLVGPKGGRARAVDDTFLLDGVAYHQSVHVSVSRTFAREHDTTTSTVVRVLPLEIVYSTAPVEALSRILSIANLEFADDYYRISSKLHDWRDRQKARLMRALAHKKKKIIVDVDVGAPVLLLPEESTGDSPLLIIDFGRLHFRNVERRVADSLDKFDDNWQLDLSKVQVQCSSAFRYRGIHSHYGEDYSAQQLIEPFTLGFTISTRIDSDSSAGETFRILASLPRLVLNVTTSAQRLLLRLQVQWKKRKVELENFVSNEVLRDSLLGLKKHRFPRQQPPVSASQTTTSSVRARIVEFHYVAPLLKFRFENDVDGRDCIVSSDTKTTPLLDLSLRGLEGGMIARKSDSGYSSLSWSAKLSALDAIDLYQGAGDDYAYLLSSLSPGLMVGRNQGDSSFDSTVAGTDLVTFSYESAFPSGVRPSPPDAAVGGVAVPADKLTINFHELYVEWNPETLAALHIAMNLPIEPRRDANNAGEKDGSSDSSDFFDAEEDAFYDALPEEVFALPEFDFFIQQDNVVPSMLPDLLSTKVALIPTARKVVDTADEEPSTTHNDAKVPFEVVFELSKLRVNFNKETRHRRLIIAEMDRTSILYTENSTGVCITKATIGNLTFTDADSAHNRTLYREILGLKTDTELQTEHQSSLLVMELVRNPRGRIYVPGPVDNEEVVGAGVLIDLARNRIHGCDYFLKMRFSPMRFVYLQQLWFEFIDYFFEGIVGYEVWGNRRPLVGQTKCDDMDSDAPNAEHLVFTKFDIQMDSPAILFPVSYCSTDFLRLDAELITIANHYECSDVRILEEAGTRPIRRSWFNYCDIVMDDLSFLSWSGRRLCEGDDPISASISLNWPTGPTAHLNAPKWVVNCTFDELFLSLQQEDYALLQNIVQHNIGEESRHLDEWHVLQNLPPLVLERYKQDIIVHFGYDKKDVTPTTFDVTLTLPVICFMFLRGESEIANVRCENIAWNFKKLPDLISRQTVTSDVEIVDCSYEACDLLLSSHRLEPRSNEDFLSDLKYTSTTHPSGDNIKTLDIVDARIHLVYSAWKRFSSFFKGLPGPSYLSPDEVIQVGDRWYKINISAPSSSNREASMSRLSWISSAEPVVASLASVAKVPKTATKRPPTSEFHLSLHRPSIMVGSDQCSLLLLADQVVFRHLSSPPRLEKAFRFTGVKLQTRKIGRDLANNVTLIHPWSIQGDIRGCSALSQCQCEAHTTVVSAGDLVAKAAYSDLTSAVEVSLLFLQDLKDSNVSEINVVRDSSVEHADGLAPPEPSNCPCDVSVVAQLKSLQLVIVDDSGRQFAGAQELVIITMGSVDFGRTVSIETKRGLEYSMRLRFTSLDIEDCLQVTTSPFRRIATIRAAHILLPEELQARGSSLESQYAIELSSRVSTSRRYDIMVRSVDAQYNPSLVIALQRFLGRLLKDVQSRVDSSVEHRSLSDGAASMSVTEVSGDRVDQKESFLALNIEHVRVCLNKEHQGRQLLEAVLTDCRADLIRSQGGLIVTGHLGVFDAWKNEHLGELGGNVLKTGGESDYFVDFRYITFSERHRTPEQRSFSDGCELPEWVIQNMADGNNEIDDCLVVSVAALEIVYQKEMASEMIDYLSNGMPGKGMGLTSQAAKGFVNKRIQTKSFLQIHAEAPRILTPCNDDADAGIDCNLGDLSLRSWVQSGQLNSDSMRRLTVSMLGLSARTYAFGYDDSCNDPLFSGININIDVEKRELQLSVRAKVSPIAVALRYTDFLTLLAVIKENVGKAVTKKKWDNLEVAWEEELSRDSVHHDSDDSPRFSNEISYSESARHVRYGVSESTARADPNHAALLLTLDCDEVSLLLHRDDDLVVTETTDSGYEVVLFVVQRLASSVDRRGGLESLSFSLGDVFLFDLGEVGRRRRRGHVDSPDAVPSPYVMMNGYSTPDGRGHFDSQVVVTVDREASLPTSISILINYLSFAALIRPLEEVYGFMSCSWPVFGTLRNAHVSADSCESHISQSFADTDSIGISTRPSPGTLVKFVMHYPRFVFAADENDRHSRALVLEG